MQKINANGFRTLPASVGFRRLIIYSRVGPFVYFRSAVANAEVPFVDCHSRQRSDRKNGAAPKFPGTALSPTNCRGPRKLRSNLARGLLPGSASETLTA